MNICRVFVFLACLSLSFCGFLSPLAAEDAAVLKKEPAAVTAEAQKPLPEKVTFSEHIAPIIFNNCSSCHRAGEVAPFDLLNYRDVKKRGRMIARVTKSRYMPPWHPVPGHGDFSDSRRLQDRDVELISRWVKTGMEEGKAASLPKMPDFPDGWQLGKPDLVVSMEKAYRVRASGSDIYRNFVVKVALPEDKWVTAIEIRPSARAVLHHSLFFLDTTGEARRSDGRDGTVGFRGMGFRRSGSLGGWAVGGTARKLPQELSMPLPREADIVLASHFHPSGKVEMEKTTLGLYFSDKPPHRKLLAFQVPPVYGSLSGIDIPAGNANYQIRDSFTVPVDIDLIGAGAHAHYIGKFMQASATLPDGTKRPLFYIDKWDFNWQGRYHYTEPVRLPKGTVINGVVSFDNSADNPFNQFDPPRRVRWGLESTDEMGSIIFKAICVNQGDEGRFERGVRQQMIDTGSRLGGRFAGRGRFGRGGSRGGSSVGGLLGRLRDRVRNLDRDGDGKIDESEMTGRYKDYLKRLDTNGDGVVDSDEIEGLGGTGSSSRPAPPKREPEKKDD
ncbi:MAG: hypothetical protein VCD16_06335 [Planctomycetota bacterium]